MPQRHESSEVTASFGVGGAGVMRPVVELARRASRSAASVLIAGEPGSGKRSLAAWIHQTSARRAGPLVRADAAAVSDALFRRARAHALPDVIAEAAGGTLVIDELCELSSEAQAALLELRDTALRATGTQGTRVIATTQHPPDQAVRRGTLRAELYYALGVITIAMPPLRARTDEIPALVASFLARSPHATATISDAALAWLTAAPWPGNVRELESTIARAIALSDSGRLELADVADLGPALATRPPPPARPARASRAGSPGPRRRRRAWPE